MQLIDIISEAKLHLLTREGVPTFKPRKRSEATTIDLTLATMNTADAMVKCGITKKLNFDSDHEAILTELDRNVHPAPPKEVRNWRKINRATFHDSLQSKLPSTNTPIATTEDLDEQVNHLVKILTKAAQDATSISLITTKSRPNMDLECKEAILKVRRLESRWQQTRDRRDKKKLNKVRNAKSRLIKSKRMVGWRQHVEECDSDEKLWC